MALSEKELEKIIKSHLSEELDATVQVPDIDNQWQTIKQRILETESIPTTQKIFLKMKKIVVAAIILISIGSITLLIPNDANALGGKIEAFFNYIVGKTTKNEIENYKQATDDGVPKVEEIGDNIEKEVTLDLAQSTVPFKLAIPRYLPSEAIIRRVLLTDMGAEVYEISIEYNLKDKVFIFRQQNSAVETSRGSLYDTDDTVVKNLTVNGRPAILLVSKNGINTLNWQSRGLLLQITGKIDEEEINKIAQSIN